MEKGFCVKVEVVRFLYALTVHGDIENASRSDARLETRIDDATWRQMLGIW
jgi:hypothetical protein